jgi:hypothetical protein
MCPRDREGIVWGLTNPPVKDQDVTKCCALRWTSSNDVSNVSLKIGTYDGPCEYGNEPPGSMKDLKNFLTI